MSQLIPLGLFFFQTGSRGGLHRLPIINYSMSVNLWFKKITTVGSFYDDFVNVVGLTIVVIGLVCLDI